MICSWSSITSILFSYTSPAKVTKVARAVIDISTLPRRCASHLSSAISFTLASLVSSHSLFHLIMHSLSHHNHLSHSLSSGRSVLSARPGEGIRPALCWSWVTSEWQLCQVYGRALFHWLQRMYLMCVAPWAASRSRVRGEERGRMSARDARRCNMVPASKEDWELVFYGLRVGFLIGETLGRGDDSIISSASSLGSSLPLSLSPLSISLFLFISVSVSLSLVRWLPRRGRAHRVRSCYKHVRLLQIAAAVDAHSVVLIPSAEWFILFRDIMYSAFSAFPHFIFPCSPSLSILIIALFSIISRPCSYASYPLYLFIRLIYLYTRVRDDEISRVVRATPTH